MTKLGFSFTLESWEMSASIAKHVVELVCSNGWEKPLRYICPLTLPGELETRRPGRLRKDLLASELTAVLLARQTSYVSMNSLAREKRSICEIITNTEVYEPRVKASGLRPYGAESTHTRWLDAVLKFARDASVGMGVISQIPDTLTSGYSFSDPSPSGCAKWWRLWVHRRELGDLYVRFPRWGTLYSHRHVAALGGTARICDVVRPAVVREMEVGVYFQLTDSISTALSQESIDKQRVFEAFVEPLLPPVEGGLS